MEIASVRYGRKFNLGNYESEEIVIEGDLDSGESAAEAIAALKAAVQATHDGETLPEDAPQPMKPKKEKPAAKKAAAPKKKAAKKEEVVEEDEEEEEIEDGLDEEEEFEDAEEDEEVEEVPKKAAKKATSKKKAPAKKATAKKAPAKKARAKKKTKASPYDRTNELHKKLIGEMLTAEVPNWRSDAGIKANCKAASLGMETHDFLDADGNILDSFVEEFMEYLGE